MFQGNFHQTESHHSAARFANVEAVDSVYAHYVGESEWQSELVNLCFGQAGVFGN